MQQIIHRVRFVRVILVGVFLLEILPIGHLHAAGAVRVENIRVEKSGAQVTILYDLIGDTAETYSVVLTLRRENVPEFQYSPTNASGDVGDGVQAGLDKKVIWNFRGEWPQGLPGDDFYIVVDVTTMKSGISPFVWIGGGVAAIAATAFLLFGGKSDEAAASTAIPTFPSEPGRPR